MNNTVYFVFGSSAAGKETFIKEAIANNRQLVDLFSWNNKKIIKVQESIDYIKQTDNDPIGDKRIEIIDIAIEINSTNSNSIILIKGQNIDLKNDLVYKLKEKLPSLEIIIIFLYTDLETSFSRGKMKAWFTDEDNNIDEWNQHIKNSAHYITKLTNFKVISIDTTDGYIKTDFPKYD